MLPSFISIVRILFTPTGSHNTQYQQPYQLSGHLDNHMLESIRHATNEGRNISAGALAPFAGSILRPAADITWDANIVGGWDQPRLRFMMEVEIQNQTGLTKQYISGYTNYNGYHKNGSQVSFDPEMHMVINRVLSLNVGSVGGIRMAGSDRLLTGDYQPTFGDSGNQNITVGLRPEDVFSIMQSSGQGGYGETILDGRTVFAGNVPKFSTIANDLPNQYLSRILKGAIPEHNMSAQDSMLATYGDALDRSIGHVAELGVNSNRILHQLLQNGGFHEGGSFTYRCLMEVGSNKGNLDDRVHLIEPSGIGGYEMGLHQAGQSANWNSATNESVIAKVIAAQVPALMSDHFLTKIAFSATNRTINREFAVDIQGAPSSWLPNPDMVKHTIQSFINRVVQEILVGISINNAIDYNLRVIVDMYGETHIYASVMGAAEVYFCSPSFADSLTTPLIARNNSYAMSYASDMESLANNTVTPVANSNTINYGNNYDVNHSI